MTRAWRPAVAFTLLLSALACTVPVDLGSDTPVPGVTAGTGAATPTVAPPTVTEHSPAAPTTIPPSRVPPSPVPPTPTPPTIDACPATVACIHVINYSGSSINFTIAGQMHTLECNSAKTIQLPPGEYTYTISDVITVEAGITRFLPFHR